MTKNDELARQVSQSGPFYDGQDAQRAAAGAYTCNVCETRSAGMTADTRKMPDGSPFASMMRPGGPRKG